MESAASAVKRVAEQWEASIDPLSGGACPLSKASSTRFANPVAFHIKVASPIVASYVLLGSDGDQAMRELDDIARIMALKDDSASASMKSFLILRNAVVGEAFFSSLSSEDQTAALSRIDECLMHTIDGFVRSREAILKISIDELKRRNKMLESMQNETFSMAGEVRA